MNKSLTLFAKSLCVLGIFYASLGFSQEHREVAYVLKNINIELYGEFTEHVITIGIDGLVEIDTIEKCILTEDNFKVYIMEYNESDHIYAFSTGEIDPIGDESIASLIENSVNDCN